MGGTEQVRHSDQYTYFHTEYAEYVWKCSLTQPSSPPPTYILLLNNSFDSVPRQRSHIFCKLLDLEVRCERWHTPTSFFTFFTVAEVFHFD